MPFQYLPHLKKKRNRVIVFIIISKTFTLKYKQAENMHD